MIIITILYAPHRRAENAQIHQSFRCSHDVHCSWRVRTRFRRLSSLEDFLYFNNIRQHGRFEEAFAHVR